MTSKFIIRGLVQGIGFRPYIARIGEELELTGFVRNTDGIVEVILKTSDIEAESENVKKMFLNALYSDLPANAIIDNILEVFCSKEDESLIKNNEFYIAGSVAASIQAVDECGDDSKFFTDGIDSNKSADSLDSHSIDPIPMIPVDLPMCDKCRAELFDKTNRRYMHPFISCTECGPRYSIINSIPYDRVNISMSKFPMCPECEKEYTAHGDRRRHAQTIACKNCGPRLELKVFGEENKTIKVEDSNALDGLNTSNALDGYNTSNALDKSNNVDTTNMDSYLAPYNKACEILKNNGIVAVKDIGGFHLACKANSPEAVNLLREIKHRDKKAFAIMFKDVDEVSKYAFLCEEEKKLLLGIDRPIVLLKRKDDSLDSDKRYFKEACGNSPYIGAMLPSNPLQEMLLHDFSYLIMTSANSSHLPMIIDNDEMVNWMEEVWKNVVKNINEKLAVLMHDRDIYTPLDDSIVSYVSGRNIITRRSRGHVPGLLYLNELSKNLADYTKNSNGTKLEKSEKLTNESEMNSSENKVAVNKVWYNIDKQDIDQQNIKVVNKDKQGLTVASRDKQGDITNCYVNKKVIYAAGGDLKNAFALRKNDRILMSQFFGDMEEASVKDLHKSRFNSMTNMFNVSPHVYVTDMHPGYKTYSLPEELSDGKTDEVEIIRVQHHHAHIASVMAEHHLYEPVIGVAFDGTGYGDDGNVWGSEFLYCDGRNYKRYGHLPYVKLIGGDEGAKNADTMLAGFIHSIYAENEDEILELYKTVQDKFADDSKIDLKDDSNNASNHDFASRYTLISKAIDNNINTVLSSSAGRLFDAVSALLNICHYNSYEGEAAIELEAMAHKSKNPFNLELKYDKIFRNILEAVEQKVPTCDIALGFINSLGDFIIAKCDEIRQETGCVNVALSGGVFQNRTLLSYVITGLEERNFRVYTNEKVPINDGGISLGQVYLASLK